MDDPALIGVHRLQRGGTSAAQYAPGDLFCQLFQGLAALFPIAVAVQEQTAVVLAVLVHQDRCQILDGIQGLASSADDGAALIVAAQFHADAVCGAHGSNGHSNAHCCVNVCNILSCTEQAGGHVLLCQDILDRLGLHATCGRIVILVNDDLLYRRNCLLYGLGNWCCRRFRCSSRCRFFIHCLYLCLPLYLAEESLFRLFQNAVNDLVLRNAELFGRQMLCLFDAFCSENLFHSHSSLS